MSSPSIPLAVIDGNVTVLPSATVAVVLPNVSTGVSAAGFTVSAIVCAADDAVSPAVVLLAVTVSVKLPSLLPSCSVSVLPTSAPVRVKLEPLNTVLSAESVMVAPAAKPAIVTVTVSSPSTPLAVIDGNVTVLPSATVAVVLPNVSTGVSAAGFTVTAIVCAADDAVSPAVVLLAVTVSVKLPSLLPSCSVSVLPTSAPVRVKLEPLNTVLSAESVMVAPAAKPAIVSVTVSSPSTPLAVIDGNVTVLPSVTVAVVLPNVSTGVSAAGFTVSAIVCAADDAVSPAVVLLAVTVSVKLPSLLPSCSVSVLPTSAPLRVKLEPLNTVASTDR